MSKRKRSYLEQNRTCSSLQLPSLETPATVCSPDCTFPFPSPPLPRDSRYLSGLTLTLKTHEFDIKRHLQLLHRHLTDPCCAPGLCGLSWSRLKHARPDHTAQCLGRPTEQRMYRTVLQPLDTEGPACVKYSSASVIHCRQTVTFGSFDISACASPSSSTPRP